MFAQIVSLRQITNIIYHVPISNNKNKHFPHKTDFRSFFRSSDSTFFVIVYTSAGIWAASSEFVSSSIPGHEKF